MGFRICEGIIDRVYLSLSKITAKALRFLLPLLSIHELYVVAGDAMHEWKLLCSAVGGPGLTNLSRRSVWYLCEGKVTVQGTDPTNSPCSHHEFACSLLAVVVCWGQVLDKNATWNKLRMCFLSMLFYVSRMRKLGAISSKGRVRDNRKWEHQDVTRNSHS